MVEPHPVLKDPKDSSLKSHLFTWKIDAEFMTRKEIKGQNPCNHPQNMQNRKDFVLGPYKILFKTFIFSRF